LGQTVKVVKTYRYSLYIGNYIKCSIAAKLRIGSRRKERIAVEIGNRPLGGLLQFFVAFVGARPAGDVFNQNNKGSN
jgi:hypothetical protein